MDKRNTISTKGHLSTDKAISPYKGQQGGASPIPGYLGVRHRQGRDKDRDRARGA